MAQNGFGVCGTARVNRQGMPEEWKISGKGISVKINKGYKRTEKLNRVMALQ